MGASSKSKDDACNLPPTKRTEWQAGSAVEVAWGMNTNHGGGYSYRLCKASDDLSEECFARGSLDFVGETTWLQSRGNRNDRKETKAESTTGAGGSMWRKNPIPNGDAGGFPAPNGGCSVHNG